MTSLAALTQAISNTFPSVAATNFSNYSSANIPSPKYSPPSAQNNIVNWKNNSSVKSPNNQSNVRSDDDDQKDPIASSLKWLGTKVVPDAIGTFLIGFITYAMSHYVLATMSPKAWIGKIPGLRGFHEKIVKINDAIRNDLGEEKYLETVNSMRRPGAIESVKKFWEVFEKIQNKIPNKDVSENFLSFYFNFFKKWNRLTTGLLIAGIAWVRTVFFSPVKEEDDKIQPFSLSAILSAGMPLLFAGIYWTFYEYLTSQKRFVPEGSNTFKFFNLSEMPFRKKFKPENGEEKVYSNSLQDKMDTFTKYFKIFTKASKRINLDFAAPVKTLVNSSIAITLSYLSRDVRTEGNAFRPVFNKTEKLLNTCLRPFKKDINIKFKFNKKKGFSGVENEFPVPGIKIDRTLDPEKIDNLNPKYDPDANESSFVLVSAFKAGLKLICDSILFSIAFKWINSFFNPNKDKNKHKKAKQSDSSSSNEKTKQQWTLPQTAGLGLTIAAATAIPVAYSLSEEDDRERKQKKNGRQLSYA